MTGKHNASSARRARTNVLIGDADWTTRIVEKFTGRTTEQLRWAARLCDPGTWKREWILALADRLDSLGYPSIDAVPLAMLPLVTADIAPSAAS